MAAQRSREHPLLVALTLQCLMQRRGTTEAVVQNNVDIFSQEGVKKSMKVLQLFPLSEKR